MVVVIKERNLAVVAKNKSGVSGKTTFSRITKSVIVVIEKRNFLVVTMSNSVSSGKKTFNCSCTE